MSLRAALKDRGYLVRPEADAEVVEGRRLFHDRTSAPFRARLTLDAGAEGTDAAGTEATAQAPRPARRRGRCRSPAGRLPPR